MFNATYIRRPLTESGMRAGTREPGGGEGAVGAARLPHPNFTSPGEDGRGHPIFFARRNQGHWRQPMQHRMFHDDYYKLN